MEVSTYLVMMRSSYENDGAIFRNIEGTSWPDFSEKDADDSSPKEEEEVVEKVRGSLRKARGCHCRITNPSGYG